MLSAAVPGMPQPQPLSSPRLGRISRCEALQPCSEIKGGALDFAWNRQYRRLRIEEMDSDHSRIIIPSDHHNLYSLQLNPSKDCFRSNLLSEVSPSPTVRHACTNRSLATPTSRQQQHVEQLDAVWDPDPQSSRTRSLLSIRRKQLRVCSTPAHWNKHLAIQFSNVTT